MNKFRLVALLCMLGTGSLAPHAANVVKEARKAMKNARYEENGNEAKNVANRLDAAEKSLMEALPNEEKAAKRAEILFTAAQVQRKFNDIENEKIYLGRAYDTTLYYNSIYKTYVYLSQCDSAEAAAGGRTKFKFRKTARKQLLDYRPNLLNGGRYYLKKKNHTEAFRFLDLYLTSANYPMLQADLLGQNDTMYVRAAYWSIATAYQIGAYEGVLRHAPTALRYPKNRAHIQEYLCRSCLALNDTVKWVHELKNGLLNFPDHMYFFTSLQEYLNANNAFDEALTFADQMVQYDPKNALFWYARALAFMNKEDYANCVSSCDVVLMLDSMHVGANYFKGLSYCNMARDASDAMKSAPLKSADYQNHRAEMIRFYAMAEQPLELMRKLSPERASEWAPLLYQVYLNLNKGPEFDEIEGVVKNLNGKKEG